MRARRAAGQCRADMESFSRWLVELGSGELQIDENGSVRIPQNLVMDAHLPTVIAWVFDELAERHGDMAYMSSRAVLAPRNAIVDTINDAVTELFPGEVADCLSADDTVNGTANLVIPQEYLNTLCVPGFPPHHLRLKPGMPIMLLRNISPTEGLCNGTRLVMNRLISGRLLEATIASGSAAGRRVFIPRLALRPPDDLFPFEWERRQFPVRPAFAVTINKAQGQTLERVAVYLDEPVFGHGQLYVAASRVGRADDLRFALPRNADGVTNNVVFTEIL